MGDQAILQVGTKKNWGLDSRFYRQIHLILEGFIFIFLQQNQQLIIVVSNIKYTYSSTIEPIIRYEHQLQSHSIG